MMISFDQKATLILQAKTASQLKLGNPKHHVEDTLHHHQADFRRIIEVRQLGILPLRRDLGTQGPVAFRVPAGAMIQQGGMQGTAQVSLGFAFQKPRKNKK